MGKVGQLFYPIGVIEGDHVGLLLSISCLNPGGGPGERWRPWRAGRRSESRDLTLAQSHPVALSCASHGDTINRPYIDTRPQRFVLT